MTKIIYEVVEHDGGWADPVDGVFSETFPSPDVARRAADRAAKEQVVPGGATGFRTKTRMVVGMTKRRQAVIDPRPTSRAEGVPEAENKDEGTKGFIAGPGPFVRPRYSRESETGLFSNCKVNRHLPRRRRGR